MIPILGAEFSLKPGSCYEVLSDSPNGRFNVVFEDDGETGYFYASESGKTGEAFYDALHLYDAAGSRARLVFKIIWSPDGMAAALLMDQMPQAVFHFGVKCSYAVDPFPGGSTGLSEGWSRSRNLVSCEPWFFAEEAVRSSEACSPEPRAQPMKLDICGRVMLHSPTGEDIRKAVHALDAAYDAFLILEKNGSTYLQCCGDARVGYRLEYQEDSMEQHFEAESGCLDVEMVVNAFQSYADGTKDWREAMKWRKLDL